MSTRSAWTPSGAAHQIANRAIAVVVVEKHHEALLVSMKKRGTTVAQTSDVPPARQARRAHLVERLGDLVRRKVAHDLIVEAARASRGGSAAVVVTRAENASARSSSVRRRAISDARSCSSDASWRSIQGEAAYPAGHGALRQPD